MSQLRESLLHVDSLTGDEITAQFYFIFTQMNTKLF
jgi:hypothetical protein